MEFATKSRLDAMSHSNARDSLITPWRLGLLAIFVLSAGLYWSALDAGLVWDDHRIVSGDGIGGGTVWGALTKPFLTYYRPFTSLSFVADRALFGRIQLCEAERRLFVWGSVAGRLVPAVR